MRNLLEHRASPGSAKDGTACPDKSLDRLPRCTCCISHCRAWLAMKLMSLRCGLADVREGEKNLRWSVRNVRFKSLADRALVSLLYSSRLWNQPLPILLLQLHLRTLTAAVPVSHPRRKTYLVFFLPPSNCEPRTAESKDSICAFCSRRSAGVTRAW